MDGAKGGMHVNDSKKSKRRSRAALNAAAALRANSLDFARREFDEAHALARTAFAYYGELLASCDQANLEDCQHLAKAETEMEAAFQLYDAARARLQWEVNAS